MKQYKLLNNVLGWVVFVISAVTYILTLEPTASFWDCGEFISSAYKLEVGHPPGNPIFMLTGRFFANFASDPTQVAYMINLMSGLLSAGTILLLFWTITHLARKIVVKEGEEMSMGQMIAILGSGLVGSLAYAFSDTFWFSAVEGEVYAYSSFCTALVFWLILKWETVADEPHSYRYIHCSTSSQFIMYSGYRTGILLQKIQKYECKRLSYSYCHFVRYNRNFIIRIDSGICKSRRMGGTFICKRIRRTFQYRCHYLFLPRNRMHFLGYL